MLNSFSLFSSCLCVPTADSSPPRCQVWGVTRDGRALVRLGVSPTNPAGLQWADVDAPSAPLKKVEVGMGSVWGLDHQGNLYRRDKTLPLFPEGTGWSLVCGDVWDVSVSAAGEVWAVLGGEKEEEGSSDGKGRLGRRTGVNADNPLGSGWEFVAGNSWATVSVKMRPPVR